MEKDNNPASNEADEQITKVSKPIESSRKHEYMAATCI